MTLSSEQITNLIAEARKYVSDHDAYADNHLLRHLADALASEHQRAEMALRRIPELIRLGNERAAERDALRAAIRGLIADLDDARAHGEIYTYGMVQDRLSRAIDTKEKP